MPGFLRTIIDYPDDSKRFGLHCVRDVRHPLGDRTSLAREWITIATAWPTTKAIYRQLSRHPEDGVMENLLAMERALRSVLKCHALECAFNGLSRQPHIRERPWEQTSCLERHGKHT